MALSTVVMFPLKVAKAVAIAMRNDAHYHGVFQGRDGAGVAQVAGELFCAAYHYGYDSLLISPFREAVTRVRQGYRPGIGWRILPVYVN